MADAVGAPAARSFARRASLGWLAFGLVWAIGLAAGFTFLWSYKLRAGEAEGAPSS